MERNKKNLTTEQRTALFEVLQTRFEQNMQRHKGLVWSDLQTKLEQNAQTLWSLNEMEQTGGEPDVVDYEQETDTYIFYDCSAESPLYRRSLCYDREALESRKTNKPENSVLDMAADMGIALLTQAQYQKLQQAGSFDLKTSSWIATPDAIRALGGALFCDRRYNQVFVYHNGAESYYAARGFRGLLKVR